jgi:LPXTG-site transpeptidase (sortase) family protein
MRKTLSPLIPARANSKLKVIGRHLGPLLLSSGIAILGYAGFQYGAMIYEQRQLQTRWREQQQRAEEQHSRAALRESNLARISIPSIQLSAIIVEGTDQASLLMGPGHLIGTAEPGEPGNAVVSAHRDTFFRKIMNLTPGTTVLIERGGRIFTYAVEGMKIVKANDRSVAAPTSDNRLTLVTCDPAYYPGPAPQRLVVFSKLVSAPAPSPSVAALKPLQAIQMKPGAVKKAHAGGIIR